MFIGHITESIQEMIEKKIFEEWKHEGHIDELNSDRIVVVIDNQKYWISITDQPPRKQELPPGFPG